MDSAGVIVGSPSYEHWSPAVQSSPPDLQSTGPGCRSPRRYDGHTRPATGGSQHASFFTVQIPAGAVISGRDECAVAAVFGGVSGGGLVSGAGGQSVAVLFCGGSVRHFIGVYPGVWRGQSLDGGSGKAANHSTHAKGGDAAADSPQHLDDRCVGGGTGVRRAGDFSRDGVERIDPGAGSPTARWAKFIGFELAALGLGLCCLAGVCHLSGHCGQRGKLAAV